MPDPTTATTTTATPSKLAAVTARVDAFQRAHRPAAIAYGVVKKYGEDRGGQYAAIISYYTFFSLFPLLMVMFTVMGWVLSGDPHLQRTITNSVLAHFPVIGNQIRDNVGSISGSGVALAVGVVLALLSGLGATQAAQDAMNTVWDVPVGDRPNFLIRRLRGLGTLGVLGVSILASTALGSIGASAKFLGIIGRIGWFVGTVAINALLVAELFRMLSHTKLTFRAMRPGMIAGGLGWTILQYVGGTYVSRIVNNASPTYGLFAVVIGLLSWIYLQAQILLYAAELASVLDRSLYPRSLVTKDPTEADRRVAQAIVGRDEPAIDLQHD